MKKKQIKLVQAGKFLAQVEVELIYTDEGWSPYLTLDDAQKLDAVRMALQAGDVETAAQLAQIYKIVPIATAA